MLSTFQGFIQVDHRKFQEVDTQIINFFLEKSDKFLVNEQIVIGREASIKKPYGFKKLSLILGKNLKKIEFYQIKNILLKGMFNANPITRKFAITFFTRLMWENDFYLCELDITAEESFQIEKLLKSFKLEI